MKKPGLALPDTNAVLRYLLRDHETHYGIANEFFEAVREGSRQALLLEGVLVECVHVLTKFYKVPRPEAAQQLRGLLQYKGIRNPNRQELLDAFTRYGESKLDIVDCMLLAASAARQLELFSFDVHLRSSPPSE